MSSCRFNFTSNFLGISNVEHCTAKVEETDPIQCSRLSIIMLLTHKLVPMGKNINAK